MIATKGLGEPVFDNEHLISLEIKLHYDKNNKRKYRRVLHFFLNNAVKYEVCGVLLAEGTDLKFDAYIKQIE